MAFHSSPRGSSLLHGILAAKVSLAVRRSEKMASPLAEMSQVVRGAVLVVPADLDSGAQENPADLDSAVQVAPAGAGRGAMAAAVVPVDSARALVLAVVAFLADPEVAFLVDREWRLGDAAISFRKTPKWPH